METTPESASTPAEATAKEEPTTPPLLKSKVDTFFDVVTARAARGLVVAQGALETVAHWLEGRAKVVGDLAAKLEKAVSEKPSSEAASTEQSPASP